MEAMELLRQRTPDLIFSDWKMPEMGGEEILRHLRNDGPLASIPVIVITAFGSSDSAIEAVRLGAYDFIAKPFDLDEISTHCRKSTGTFIAESRIGRVAGKGWAQWDSSRGASHRYQRTDARSV